jgi:hypothetical protein
MTASYKGSPYGLSRVAASGQTFAQANTDNVNTTTFYTGGYNTKTLPMDPFVSGFSFIKWIVLPTWLKAKYSYFAGITEKNLKSFNGNDDVEISPIGVQIGFTSNESQFAGAIGTKGQGFTMGHNEFSGSPVSAAYNYWVSSIRDPHSGIASYVAETGTPYSARNHSGELLYVVLKPSAGKVGATARDLSADIESATYYTNVVPLKIFRSHLNFTAGTQENTPLEQTFMADRWFGAGVLEYAAATLSSFASIQALQTENVGNFGA